MSMRPSEYISVTRSTVTLHPAFTMPPSRASTTPNSDSSRIASPTISLYRSSKMCSGKRVRGKTTTRSGNRGSTHAAMLLLSGKFSMRLDGKVVIITGASEGIGAACAAEFARAGCKLSLTARSEENLCRVAGPDALVTAGDICLEDTRRRLVDRTLERFGAIDILINNAGAGLYAPSWRAPMDDVRRMMELNFFAPMMLTQLVMPA